MFPFGRRQFAFELLPLLEAAKARGLPTAVSLRDILVAKSKPERIAETVAVVRRLVDRVLVHGDPRLVGLEATFPGAAEIADRLVYTGYVADAGCPSHAGGGRRGGPGLGRRRGRRRAAAARRLGRPAGHQPRRGALAADRRAQSAGGGIRRAASSAALQAGGGGVTVERFRSDFPALLARSRLSLSQAGYNTVMDILAVGARALVLPFAEGAESEQSLRARLLAERGLLSLMEPPIEPARLAAAIEAALRRPRPQPGALDLDGAAETARQLAGMLR